MSGHDFSCADKPSTFVIPSGLSSARDPLLLVAHRVDLSLARLLHGHGGARRGGRIKRHAFAPQADEQLGLNDEAVRHISVACKISGDDDVACRDKLAHLRGSSDKPEQH